MALVGGRQALVFVFRAPLQLLSDLTLRQKVMHCMPDSVAGTQIDGRAPAWPTGPDDAVTDAENDGP